MPWEWQTYSGILFGRAVMIFFPVTRCLFQLHKGDIFHASLIKHTSNGSHAFPQSSWLIYCHVSSLTKGYPLISAHLCTFFLIKYLLHFAWQWNFQVMGSNLSGLEILKLYDSKFTSLTEIWHNKGHKKFYRGIKYGSFSFWLCLHDHSTQGSNSNIFLP